MISISRRHARLLSTVFRRSNLGLGHRGPAPPLILKAEGSQLRAHYRYAGLALEQVDRGSYQPAITIPVPLEALAEAAGRDDSTVVIEAAQPDQTVVRWDDRGIPQARSYAVPEVETLGKHPPTPRSFQTADSELWAALACASLIASDRSTRYALDCIQLRGKSGRLAATDGHQLLVHQGWAFPWKDDVLVRRSPLFACTHLTGAGPLQLGRTATHVVLRQGPWTIWLEIQTNGRFPEVDRVIPAPAAIRSRLQFDMEDAQFLRQALNRLPGARSDDQPVTLDLDSRVAVQAQAEPGTRVTELVLMRSRMTGAPIRLATHRRYLARALELGLHELEFSGAAEAICGRDARRIYAWQPLSESALIARPEHPLRIETTNAPGAPPRPRRTRPAAPSTGQQPSSAPRPDGRHRRQRDSQPVGWKPGGFTSLVEEAQSLRTALGAARACTGRLLQALRFERKRSRQVESTLATLRQIRLPESQK